jgi:ribosomal protein S6E (S10)
MIVNLANPKAKKTYTVKTEGPVFMSKKLGETVDLGVLNLKGKGQITGGSTKTGFPMVPFVSGSINKQVLLSDGMAFKAKHKGEKRRKTVFGDTINEAVEQVNVKILELDASVDLDVLFPKAAKEEKKK